MSYLSQLLGQTVYFQEKPYGKIIDMAIFENRPNPPVSKIEIKKGKHKLTISPHALQLQNGRWILNSNHMPQLPYDHKDFYLAEDLLDKQVIDIDGRRVVRVNDVVIEANGEMKVIGIDVGFTGILRRLGINVFSKQAIIIPWQFIQAFDYQTGSIQIKLTQTNLAKLHPAEIADLIEDVGTKERLGIVESLDANKAAAAIEETDSETQASLLEDIPANELKDILNKMRISKLADILGDLRVDKSKEIESVLSTERAERVRKLLTYDDNEAGGLMHPHFVAVDKKTTVKELVKTLKSQEKLPEAIVVTNGDNKLVGSIKTKNFLTADSLAVLEDIVEDKQFVYSHIHIGEVIALFSEYNLRILPVVNADKQPIGVILIDDILSILEEEKENDSI